MVERITRVLTVTEIAVRMVSFDWPITEGVILVAWSRWDERRVKRTSCDQRRTSIEGTICPCVANVTHEPM